MVIGRTVASAIGRKAKARSTGGGTNGAGAAAFYLAITDIHAVLRADVPVDTRQHFGTLDFGRVVVVSTCFVAIGITQVLADGIHFGCRRARHVGVGLAKWCGRSSGYQCLNLAGLILRFVVQEEEQFVLDDRATDPRTNLFEVERGAVLGNASPLQLAEHAYAETARHRAAADPVSERPELSTAN